MSPTTANETIVEEITIKGPADRIFEAIADPQERLKWWGAKGAYESTEMESDLRPWREMDHERGCQGEYIHLSRRIHPHR